jgi:hypothetical protein
MSVQKQIWEMCSERGADALGSQRRYSMAMTCLAPSILGVGFCHSDLKRAAEAISMRLQSQDTALTTMNEPCDARPDAAARGTAEFARDWL